MLTMRLLQVQRCRFCDEPIDGARVAEARTILALFGVKKGWRVCRCGQTVSNKVRTEIRDRRGFVRHVYRLVRLDVANSDGLDHWSCRHSEEAS